MPFIFIICSKLQLVTFLDGSEEVLSALGIEIWIWFWHIIYSESIQLNEFRRVRLLFSIGANSKGILRHLNETEEAPLPCKLVSYLLARPSITNELIRTHISSIQLLGRLHSR